MITMSRLTSEDVRSTAKIGNLSIFNDYNIHTQRQLELFNAIVSDMSEMSVVSFNNARLLWIHAEKVSENDSEDDRWLCITSRYNDARHFLSISSFYRRINLNNNKTPNYNFVAHENESDKLLTNLLEKISDGVKESIAMLRNGTYNDMVRQKLPNSFRAGTITRKKLWEAAPSHKYSDRAKLTESQIKMLTKIFDNGNYSIPDEKLIPNDKMTANKYYRLCEICYRIDTDWIRPDIFKEKLRFKTLTAKEKFIKRCDGRIGTLLEIDQDSPEEFLNWYNNDFSVHDHAFGIEHGFYLQMEHTHKGWYAELNFRDYDDNVGLRRFLELYMEDIPVMLSRRTIEKYTKIFNASDALFVLPSDLSVIGMKFFGITDKNISDSLRLPSKEDDEYNDVMNAISWKQPPALHLMDEYDTLFVYFTRKHSNEHFIQGVNYCMTRKELNKLMSNKKFAAEYPDTLKALEDFRNGNKLAGVKQKDLKLLCCINAEPLKAKTFHMENFEMSGYADHFSKKPKFNSLTAKSADITLCKYNVRFKQYMGTKFILKDPVLKDKKGNEIPFDIVPFAEPFVTKKTKTDECGKQVTTVSFKYFIMDNYECFEASADKTPRKEDIEKRKLLVSIYWAMGRSEWY